MRSRSRKTQQSGTGGEGGNKQDHGDPYTGFLHNYSKLKIFESSFRASLIGIKPKTRG